MSTYLSGSRTIVCIVCKRHRHTVNIVRDICARCERLEADGRVGGDAAECAPGQLSKVRHPGAGPLYVKPKSRKDGVCSGCSKAGPIYEEAASLCKMCNQAKLRRRDLDVMKVKIRCVVCNQMRRRTCLNENICRKDYLIRGNGYGICIGCGKEKLIWVKKGGVQCALCYDNYHAARALKRFVKSYAGLNDKIFFSLIDTVDWSAVTVKTNRRFRDFGKFLQTVSLSEPLTWESIEEALPTLGATKRDTPRYIRTCLLDIAHLRVAQGLLETREDYLLRRMVRRRISQSPECFREPLQRYVDWQAKLKNSPETICYSLLRVKHFLWWCDSRNIKCSSEVSVYIFEEYEQFITWKWVCERCNSMLSFDLFGKTPGCNSCEAVDTMRKTRRSSHATVQIYRSILRMFFNWAETDGLGPNPVSAVRICDYTFRHYSDDVISGLAKYIVSPDSEPREALVLYLIIFHAFSVWELTHASMPGSEIGSGLSDGYCVLLPRRKWSRHNLSPGRPERRVDFPDSAASWLKPLLQRYEQWRLETLDNPNNTYLLVGVGRARHDNPVSASLVKHIVKVGSVRAGVGECNPKTLRTTAGVRYADSGVTGVLTWLGWSPDRGFTFTWLERREVVNPRNPLQG